MKRDSALTLLLLLGAFVAGFLAIWAVPSTSLRATSVDISNLSRAPQDFWGRAVRIRGRAEALEGQGYALKDWAGSTLRVISSAAPPEVGQEFWVTGMLGQLPENALVPVIFELGRDRVWPSGASVAFAVVVVLVAVGLAVAILARLERNQNLEGGFWIKVLQGPDEGSEFAVRQDVALVGRPGERDNQISLSDVSISRSQGRFVLEKGRLFFENESFTNPTLFRGKPILRMALFDKARLEMGETVLEIRLSV